MVNLVVLRRLGAGVLLYIFVAALFLANDVRRDLISLRSSEADNYTWTLSQVEVDILSFLRSLEAVDRLDAQGVPQLRKRFDILYSRVSIITDGLVFTDLRNQPVFSSLINDIKAYMVETTRLVDGPNDELLKALPNLIKQTAQAHKSARELAIKGVLFFADQAKAYREAIASTLSRLAILVVVFVIVAAQLAWYSKIASQKLRRRQKQLASANARLNKVLEASLDAVFVADGAGNILSFNRAAERMFLYEEQDVIGKSLLKIVFPSKIRSEIANRLIDLRNQPISEQRGIGPLKMDAHRSDRSVFPAEVAFEIAESNEDLLLIGFLSDISQQVAAENELVSARDRALAGERAKGEFLNMMTHEIRTPLNGILGNLLLLEDTRLDDRQSRYVQSMNTSGKLLMRHVNAVLDVARFEAGEMPLLNERVNLHSLLDDLVNSQIGRAHAHGTRLSWHWESAPVTWVNTDGGRLQQLLLNLIDNAIKYTRNGQIDVEVENHGMTPSKGCEQIEFRVIDTGMGIDEENLEKIFEDFQTNDTSFQRVAGGTGLGLGIVRRLVQAMDGELGVESEPGAGSVFWFRLPIRRADAPSVKEITSKSGVERNRELKILLVEDNEINQQVACELLGNMGHNVTIAENGLEGVRAAKNTRFDLIFVDIAMPVMDGLEAARQIRAGGANHEVPIIAMSANILPGSKAEFKEAGMTDFLGKPFSKQELSSILGLYGAPEQQLKSNNQPDDDTLLSLRDNPDMFARYQRELGDLATWLSGSAPKGDEMKFRAHKTAGSAAAFGDLVLRDKLAKLERMLMEETSCEIEIDAHVSDTIRSISEHISS